MEKPITSLPDHDSCKKILQISPLAKKATRWWIMTINRLRIGNLPIKDPLYLFPSNSISVCTDASGVHTDRNRLQRGRGVCLPNKSLVRFIWTGNEVWIRRHGHSITLLQSITCLQFSNMDAQPSSSIVIMLEHVALSGKVAVNAHTPEQSLRH